MIGVDSTLFIIKDGVCRHYTRPSVTLLTPRTVVARDNYTT